MSVMAQLRASPPAVTGSAADFLPPRPTLPKLREAARGCRGCHLWINATQTVFGEGPSSVDVMFVGEAPGDLEDRAGLLFVGPAGKLLDTAMLEAGIDRTRVYVTNSVKHFKFVVIERGRRLHKKPSAAEVRACNPWLQEEIQLVRPRVIVALGATAAQSLLGKQFRVTQQRGKPDDERKRARREFVADLKAVARYLRCPKKKVAGSP